MTKKQIIALIGIVTALIYIAGSLIISFSYPDLTHTRLFLNYWYFYVPGWLILMIIYYFYLKED